MFIKIQEEIVHLCEHLIQACDNDDQMTCNTLLKRMITHLSSLDEMGNFISLIIPTGALKYIAMILEKGNIDNQIHAAWAITNIQSVRREMFDKVVKEFQEVNLFDLLMTQMDKIYRVCMEENNGQSLQITADNYFEYMTQLLWALSNLVAERLDLLNDISETAFLRVKAIIKGHVKDRNIAEIGLAFFATIAHFKENQTPHISNLAAFDSDIVFMCHQLLKENNIKQTARWKAYENGE